MNPLPSFCMPKSIWLGEDCSVYVYLLWNHKGFVLKTATNGNQRPVKRSKLGKGVGRQKHIVKHLICSITRNRNSDSHLYWVTEPLSIRWNMVHSLFLFNIFLPLPDGQILRAFLNWIQTSSVLCFLLGWALKDQTLRSVLCSQLNCVCIFILGLSQ